MASWGPIAVLSVIVALAGHAMAADQLAQLAPNGKLFVEVMAKPAKGFNFPYLLYVPPGAGGHVFSDIVVEPNNSPDVSHNLADLTVETRAAVKLATGYSLGNGVAERLDAALLVPVFPRPAIGDGDLYTYSLSRATLLVASGKLKRIDTQLIAMIEDARHRLRTEGHCVGTKILIDGYSGSGMFASRFVFLHPDLVQAAAFGGVNGFVMLPVRAIDGHDLTYPVGLSDYQNIVGHAFDRATYDLVPQIALMGANDTNDAVPFDDAYDPEQARLIFLLLGKKMLPDRWQAVEKIYRSQHTRVTFKTYAGIGHGLDERIWSDVAGFFRAAAPHPGDLACVP
jgi:hypothetical protein